MLLHVEYADADFDAGPPPTFGTAVDGDALQWATPNIPNNADQSAGTIGLDLVGYRVALPSVVDSTFPVFAGILENANIVGNPRTVTEITTQVNSPVNIVCYGRAVARCNMATAGVIRAGIPLVLDTSNPGQLTEMSVTEEHQVVAWFMDQTTGPIAGRFRVMVKGMS